jgi:putative phage-type endonuclease
MSLINDIKTDIHNICEECFHNNHYPIHLDELTAYVVSTLHSNKDYDPKYIYPEYFRQLIAELYPNKYSHFYFNFNNTNQSHQVNLLKNIPQVTQRTEEWYKIKQNTIGASECSVVFDANPYDTLNSFILKKCGHSPPEQQKMNSHCQHGIKYEPIIQQLYSKYNNTLLFEFGSISHHRIKFISASPDGITPSGIMVEIKAPPKREITGIPPIYYWYQMQQQLQVCNLKKVDFIECRITEYINYAEFIDDTSTKEKGVILEYILNDKIDYIYPDINIDNYDDWIMNHPSLPENAIFTQFIYWKLEIYNTTSVWRDDIWWIKSIPKYYEVWNKIEFYRKNDYTELLPKKRIKKEIIDINQ